MLSSAWSPLLLPLENRESVQRLVSGKYLGLWKEYEDTETVLMVLTGAHCCRQEDTGPVSAPAQPRQSTVTQTPVPTLPMCPPSPGQLATSGKQDGSLVTCQDQAGA